MSDPTTPAAAAAPDPTPADPAPDPAAAERAERRARQLDHCVEMQDMAMDLARQAHRRALADPAPDPDPAAPRADPVLAFARATNVARQAITLENRIADGPPPRAPRYTAAPAAPPRPAFQLRPVHHPRHAQLRQALHEIADRTVADRGAQKQLRRHVDDHLDRFLTENPELRLSTAFKRVARELGYTIDWSQVPDELLTPPPGVTQLRPGSRFAENNPFATPPPDH